MSDLLLWSGAVLNVVVILLWLEYLLDPVRIEILDIIDAHEGSGEGFSEPMDLMYLVQLELMYAVVNAINLVYAARLVTTRAHAHATPHSFRALCR